MQRTSHIHDFFSIKPLSKPHISSSSFINGLIEETIDATYLVERLNIYVLSCTRFKGLFRPPVKVTGYSVDQFLSHIIILNLGILSGQLIIMLIVYVISINFIISYFCYLIYNLYDC